MAMKMMIPPIVGVPALVWWPLGPSSRMFWPNSRWRRNSMNFGLRNRHISSDAVPAISTRPESGARHASSSLAPSASADELQAHPARGLDEHDVARARQLWDDRRGLAGVGHGVGLAAEALGDRRRQRPDRDQDVDAGGGGVLAELRRGNSRSSGPSSSMSPSTATRRAAVAGVAVAARSSRAARIDIGLAL